MARRRAWTVAAALMLLATARAAVAQSAKPTTKPTAPEAPAAASSKPAAKPAATLDCAAMLGCAACEAAATPANTTSRASAKPAAPASAPGALVPVRGPALATNRTGPNTTGAGRGLLQSATTASPSTSASPSTAGSGKVVASDRDVESDDEAQADDKSYGADDEDDGTVPASAKSAVPATGAGAGPGLGRRAGPMAGAPGPMMGPGAPDRAGLGPMGRGGATDCLGTSPVAAHHRGVHAGMKGASGPPKQAAPAAYFNSPAGAALKCTACASPNYTLVDGSCACSAGYGRVPSAGSMPPCTKCPPGTISAGVLPAKEAAPPRGARASDCKACPAGTVPNAQQSKCI